MRGTARRFAAAIKAVGGTAYLVRGDERVAFAASVQPRLTVEERDSEPLGTGAVRLCDLFAAAGDCPALAEGDAVEWQGQTYYVLRAEVFALGDEPLYYRAAVRRGAGQ
jgi:hypothetical protein